MTPLQFTRRRRKLFRTQVQAAEALGVTVGTVSHWETGRRPVPAIAIKFLECLEEREHLGMLVKKYCPKNMGDTITFRYRRNKKGPVSRALPASLRLTTKRGVLSGRDG